MNLPKILTYGSLLLLLSCSSMEVDFEDIYGNQLPEDFNWRAFIEINPDIKLAQTLSTVSALNLQWREAKLSEGLTSGAVNTIETNSRAAFVESVSAPGAELAREYLMWPEDSIAVMITEAANTSRKSYLNRYCQFGLFDEFEIFEIRSKISTGEATSEDLAAAFKSLTDSLVAFIEGFPVDSVAYVQTYVNFGRRDGRPYRACSAEEKQTLRDKELHSSGGDYSAYRFCADTDVKPYLVYVIP